MVWSASRPTPTARVPALLGDVVVVDQSPESGAQAARGAFVKLFTAGGGDAGVSEPLRPRPPPLVGRKMLDEPADEAAG